MRTLPERLPYRFKRAVLGPPPVSSSPRKERLSKRAALGVLSSDRVSSSAYGSEQILIALVPAVGWRPSRWSCLSPGSCRWCRCR